MSIILDDKSIMYDIKCKCVSSVPGQGVVLQIVYRDEVCAVFTYSDGLSPGLGDAA